MKVLIDTNAVIDVLTNREPHFAESADIFAAAQKGEFTGVIGAPTITTIFYLIARSNDASTAKTAIKTMLKLFEVASVNSTMIREAIYNGDFSDFEDAVLVEAGIAAGVIGIVTRNTKDFKKSSLAIYSPSELIAVLTAEK